MNNKLDLIKKTRDSLEKLYLAYDGNIGGGDLIIITELEGILYKGKQLSFDQNIISFKNNEGFLNIDGLSENDKTPHKSWIRLSKTKEEVKFCDLEEDSQEHLWLSELIQNINSLINSSNTKKL